jgi:hypothetical protein
MINEISRLVQALGTAGAHFFYGKPSVDEMQEDYEQKMQGIYG